LEVSTPVAPETDRPSSTAQQETTVGDTVERPQWGTQWRDHTGQLLREVEKESRIGWSSLAGPWKMSWTDNMI